MRRRKFDPKRVPGWQVRLRVDRVSKLIIKQMAGGDIKKVNEGMIKTIAAKQKLPVNELVAHLKKLGAEI